jgi:serine/threonine protein kinase
LNVHVFKALLQILHGLNFLHHNMIIHRDIKGDNVCMSAFVARIIDFGMARSLIVDGPRADNGEMLQHHIENNPEEHERQAHEGEEEEEPDDRRATRDVSCQRSTAQYSAPEAFLSKGHYDSKVDVWAVGCLLSELLYCCDSSQLTRNSSSSNKFLARFLFRPARNGDSSLPMILRYLVASPGDLVDAPGGTVKVISERMLSTLVSRGFIDREYLPAVNRGFTWVDLASKFPTPALPADEVPIFEKLRTLMMRMLTFDPDQRYSAADALNFLTGAVEHPVRLADNVLQEFRTLQQMLDEGRIGPHREKCLKFIRHVDPEHPSDPSPLSLLLD